MDEAWITTNLKDQLDASGTNVILLSTPEAGTHSIAVSAMATMFPTVSPVTYAALSATPQAKGGWQTYFDDWKEKGYIA